MTQNKPLIIGVVVVGVVGLCFMLFCVCAIAVAALSAAAPPTPSTKPIARATSAPIPADAPPADTAYKIGDNVTVGEVRWLITEAKDEGQTLKAANEFIEPKTTAGKFLRVSFEVENLGKEPKSFMGLDVLDSQGRKFQNYAEGAFFIEQSVQCIIEPLNPGLPVQCQAIYELPANAEGLAANPGDLNMFGGEAAVIMLQ